MKKALLILVVSFFAALTAYAAPDRSQKADVGFNLSGVFPSQGDFSDATYAGGSVSYGINKNVALGLSVGYAVSNLEIDPGTGSKVTAGDIGLIPVFGDIIIRIPNQSQFVPYGVLGLGVLFPSTNENKLDAQNLLARHKDGFAGKLGAGVDWFATNNLIFNLETDYIFTDASVEIVTTDTHTRVLSRDLDYWFVGGGVKYTYD